MYVCGGLGNRWMMMNDDDDDNNMMHWQINESFEDNLCSMHVDYAMMRIEGLFTVYPIQHFLKITPNSSRHSFVLITHRLAKEVASYEKEAKTQEAKIQGMKDQGKDIYDIKKQEEVLQESYMMIPDSKARYQNALEDLQSFLVSCYRGDDRVGWICWGHWLIGSFLSLYVRDAITCAPTG